MAGELLVSRTKLVVPQRRKELLSRTRLLDLLSDLLDYRLIIIAAPAGYGKTSLLIDFASQFEWPFCWFALDPLDNDLHRFLSHFVMSIRQKFPTYGEEAINLLSRTPADQINTELLISALTNDLYEKISEHFVIVLDDYHLIKTNTQIDQFLSDFIQRADDNCHIAITSRKLLTLPDLPLMVARSQVGGLSIEELAFIPDEIHKLYNHIFNQQISPQDAADLAAQTDGWITGLLLTSQTLKSGLGEQVKISRASGIGLYEYLTQQVFDLQTAEMQTFLLHSSILEEFNAEMCASILAPVTGQQQDFPRLMDRLVHDNLFVLPVDDEYQWLRYHHLFRDFLQSKLEQQNAEIARQIRLELARYFYQQQDYERVMDIYHHLNQIDFMVSLVEEVGSNYIARGKMVRLAEWLERIPEENLRSNPRLLAIQAVVAVNQGRVQEGKEQLDMVIRLSRESHNEATLAENLIRRSSALQLLGHYDQASADAQEAIRLTQNQVEQVLLYAEALRVRGFIAFQAGQMKKGLEDLLQALEIYQQQEAQEDAARVLVEVGAIYENLGEFEKAEAALQESLAYWQSVGDSIWMATILNNLGVLQHLTGNYVTSFYNLEKSISYARATNNLRMQGYALASIGDLYRDLEAGDEASSAYQEATHIARQIEDQYLLFFLTMAEARLALNRSDLPKARQFLDSVCAPSLASQSPYEEHKCLLEQAVFEICSANFAAAEKKLASAAHFFNQEGHLEDQVRSLVLTLILASQSSQEDAKTRKAVTALLKAISDPARRTPCLAVMNELRAYIKARKKNLFSAELMGPIEEHISEFRKEMQKSRRRIRNQASVVPFAPAKISIRTFGKTEISVNQKKLTIADWKTTTSRDLFLLFLAHPEGLTKEEVGEIMWPDSSPAELKLRFKNAIYRMRHAIGSEVVVFKDNYYQFNRYIDYEYDVQNFITLTNQAREATKNARKIENLQAAVKEYQGDYLPDIDEVWVLPDRQKYRDMHIQNLLNLAELCSQEKNYEQGLDYCQLAIAEDVCQEEAYRLSMQIHAQLGNKAAISRQYHLCQTQLREEVGAEPSPQTVALFERLMR